MEEVVFELAPVCVGLRIPLLTRVIRFDKLAKQLPWVLTDGAW